MLALPNNVGECGNQFVNNPVMGAMPSRLPTRNPGVAVD